MKRSNFWDVVVVGGGHAGVEAALISSFKGCTVLLITMDIKALGRMSCNPAIGGLAKGQMVREIDVLGGKMASFADLSGIQFKTLNKSKGRAVWSPRAQVDKRAYEKEVSLSMENSPVSVFKGEVVSVSIEKSCISGVVLRSGEEIKAHSVIVTSGTFLSGIIHIGERKILAGRMGEERSEGLTESLCSLGFRSGRLKTGTPPRLDKKSIDWSKTSLELGDKDPVPFSYFTGDFKPRNVPCHSINTNVKAHEIIQENNHLSPMFSGDIGGMGPRYCPSIEDKVHRFIDRDSHGLFLEPEWENSDQIYLNGFSTSLPEKIQIKALKEIPGFGEVSFFRPGYAIEYDFFPPSQLKNTLETATASQTASNLQASQVAQMELTALINKTAEALQVTTDATAVGKAAVVDSDAAAAAAVVQKDLQKDQQEFTSGENDKDRNQQLELQRTKYKAELLKIKAAKVGEIKDFYDETTGRIQPHERMVDGSWEPRGGDKAADASTFKGLTLQVSYNDKGEEVKGYMNGTDFVQVGGAKAVKAGTKKEALAYFTGQAKYILGGAQNSFMAAKLTDDDTKLMREWIPEAEAAFKANPNMSLSQIVKNIMFKPWVLDDADITDADITAGEAEASAAGSNALDSIEYARQISTRRQPDFVKAQTAYDNIMGPQGNKNTDVLFKRMKKMGYNPDYLIK